MVRRLYACPGFPKTCRHMCIPGLSSYQLRCSRRYCRGCGNRSVHPGLGCWRILLWRSFPHRFKHLHGAEGASHTKFELYPSNLWWVFWFETISQNSTRTTCWSFASSVGSSGSSDLIAFKQFASMQPMPFSKVDADQPCWRTGFGDGILLSTMAPKWGGAKVPSFIYLWIQVTKFRVSWGMVYLSFATICSNGFGADNFARNSAKPSHTNWIQPVSCEMCSKHSPKHQKRNKIDQNKSGRLIGWKWKLRIRKWKLLI